MLQRKVEESGGRGAGQIRKRQRGGLEMTWQGQLLEGSYVWRVSLFV